MKTRKNLLILELVGLALVGISREGYGATLGFQSAVNYTVGTAPRAVASGDFNGDGKMDLAVANGGNAGVGDNGSVSILLGNGDGTFQPANNIPAGKNPLSIAVGDFNGDSRLDLVVADSGSDTAGVLLGNGDGTFRSSVGYATGVGPTSIAVGDFNGDSRLDLVVANNGSSTVSMLLGNGDGTFQSHLEYTAGTGPIAVAIGDFNGDGRLDLVVANGSNGGVLLGNGDGTFEPEVSYRQFFSAAVGEFNNDNKVDLVVTRPGVGNGTITTVDLLTGIGDGTFSTDTKLDTGKCQNRFPLALDFDGDDKLDLAVMGGFSIQDGVCAGHHLDVVVLPGNGDGTFQAGVTFISTDAANLILGAASFDLNGDKAPDLVTVNNDNTLSVLLNAASTDFSISASMPNPDTVRRGQRSTSTVSLSLLNAFDNAVALTCSVQPMQSAPACSLDRDSVTFDANGNATATLTISTGAAAASVAPSTRHDSPAFRFGWLPIVGFAFMGVGFGSRLSIKGKLTVCLLGGILFSGLILQVACGGGSSGPRSQTYTITVTGASGSTQHSTTVLITVR